MALSTRDNLKVAGADVDAAPPLFPSWNADPTFVAGLLSGGEQQMLTLARDLCREPHVLIADELSMGLCPCSSSGCWRLRAGRPANATPPFSPSNSMFARHCVTPTRLT